MLRQFESNEPTISFTDLPDETQEEIDRYPERGYAFFVKREGEGFQVHATEENLLDLLSAQGGMDEGWYRVVFSSEE